MRLVGTSILFGLLVAVLLAPGVGPSVALGQTDPTATPTVAAAVPTATTLPTATPLAAGSPTAIPTVTGTTTPGTTAQIVSVSPNTVGSVNSNQITITGANFMPNAVITLSGRAVDTR